MIILIDNKEHNIPQSFNEMNVGQLAVYVKEFILNRNALFEADKAGKWQIKNESLFNKAISKMLFYLLAPLSWRDYVKMDESWKHYLLFEEKLLAFISTDMLTQIPVPKFQAGYKTFYGPSKSELLATEEFSYADKTYHAFFKTQDKKYLNLFVATLYRPTTLYRKFAKGIFHDVRKPFNKHYLEARAKQIERVPYDLKLAIWFWYHCYRASLPKLHPHVFTTSNETKASNSDWLNVILSIASDGPFGNYNQVCNEQIHLVLRELNRRAEINKEIKRKHA